MTIAHTEYASHFGPETGKSPLYFKKIRFVDFRCFKDVTVEFGRLTVFVGPNGSGKRSALEGICILRNECEDAKREVFRAPLTLTAKTGEVFVAYPDPTRKKTQLIPSWSSGGLASLLRTRHDAQTVAAIEDGLRTMLPSFQGVRLPEGWEELDRCALNDKIHQRVLAGCFDPQATELSPETLDFEVNINGRWMSKSDVSEGTGTLIRLLSHIHTHPWTTSVVLGNIDIGLHPEGQTALGRYLTNYAASVGGKNIVCTTHSPYFVDGIPAESVRVMSANKHGYTECKKLTEHWEWDQWKGTMRPGEFWSTVGEGWVNEQAPTTEAPITTIQALENLKNMVPSVAIAGFAEKDGSSVWFQVPVELSGDNAVWEAILRCGDEASRILGRDLHVSVTANDLSKDSSVERFLLPPSCRQTSTGASECAADEWRFRADKVPGAGHDRRDCGCMDCWKFRHNAESKGVTCPRVEPANPHPVEEKP